MVLHILPSIFVARTHLGTQLSPSCCILTITGQNGIFILILTAGAGVVDVLQIVFRIRGSIMELQLTAQCQCISTADGHGIVQLEDVVGGFVLIL